MRIDILDTFEAFTRVKQNWDDVYEADPEAQAFLSWGWIYEYLDKVNRPWLVLAAKPAPMTDYVAFFPLRLRTKVRPDGTFYNEVLMAGNMAADYTGILCRPEFQEEAIAALARHLRRSSWATLHLENVRSSAERQHLFMQFFPEEQFRLRDIPRVNKRDGTNNRICPVLDLPADWESYLVTLSSNTRQKIRRFLKRVDTTGEFNVTHADHRTFARDLDLLLRFWETKWRPRKGTRTDHLLRFNRSMLTAAYERGALSLPVLWNGDVPLAALALFRDTAKKSLLFYMAGRDETFSSPPPGFVLHSHCIRKATEDGFKTYDFLRGNEPYKYLFGAKEHHITCLAVSTKDKRNIGGRLDPRSLPTVLARTSKRFQSGHLSEAEAGYRQILQTDPRHAGALYGLGQVLALKGEHRAARKVFRALVGIEPESWKAWFR